MLALGLFDMTGGLENSSESGSSAEAGAVFHAEGLPGAWAPPLGCRVLHLLCSYYLS